MSEVVYINANNYEMGARELPFKVESLVIWGGVSANCGEDNLSRIVDKNSHTLKRMVFFPDYTKGGKLVRPKYYKGNRDGRATFPVLNFMAINAVVGNPFRYGWDMPSLRDLVFLARDGGFDNASTLQNIALKKFLDIRIHCPLLDRIYFRKSSPSFNGRDEEWLPLTLDAPQPLLMDAYTVLIVHGPCGADWSQARVILAARGTSSSSDCLISKLPYNVLQYIVQFMGRGFSFETPVNGG